eukprot:363520-Chlamydomonas_euryale.AAC.10
MLHLPHFVDDILLRPFHLRFGEIEQAGDALFQVGGYLDVVPSVRVLEIVGHRILAGAPTDPHRHCSRGAPPEATAAA